MLCFDDFILFLFRIGTIVEVHSGPLAAQTEDLETISTGEVKNSSVDLVEGALTLTGIKSKKNQLGEKWRFASVCQPFFPSLCFCSNDVNFHPESHEDSMNSWFLKKKSRQKTIFC